MDIGMEFTMSPVGEPRMVRRRILAVDDNPVMTRLIKMNLESQDIEVLEAGDSSECLKVVGERGDIALILLEVTLSGGVGWSVLGRLREMEAARHIPVIVVSVGPPEPELMKRWRPEGHLQKPFDVRNLVGMVGQLLARGEKGEESHGSSQGRW
jgi:CheY-like chemotaxis protein